MTCTSGMRASARTRAAQAPKEAHKQQHRHTTACKRQYTRADGAKPVHMEMGMHEVDEKDGGRECRTPCRDRSSSEWPNKRAVFANEHHLTIVTNFAEVAIAGDKNLRRIDLKGLTLLAARKSELGSDVCRERSIQS